MFNDLESIVKIFTKIERKLTVMINRNDVVVDQIKTELDNLTQKKDTIKKESEKAIRVLHKVKQFTS